MDDNRVRGTRGDDVLELQDKGGAFGLAGDDTFILGKSGRYMTSQIHAYGAEGDDVFYLDVAVPKNEHPWVQGHHVFGGIGSNTYVFEWDPQQEGRIVGRIDDFDISRDTIQIDDGSGPRVLDLANPGALDARVIAYLGQQWLVIGERVFYALEGARDTPQVLPPSGWMPDGQEYHFLTLPEPWSQEVPRSLTVSYDDPVNYATEAMIAGKVLVSVPNNETVDGVEGPVSVVTGTDAAEFIRSRATVGNTTFYGGGGDDVIEGGKGHDVLYGGEDNDIVLGGVDRDTLYGESGNDTLYGGSEEDLLFGGDGDDWLYGGPGDDVLHGDAGVDRLFGGRGDDHLYGGEGNDWLYGVMGHNVMEGGAGRDRLFGGGHADTMYGGTEDDLMRGWSGDDVMFGDDGNDTMEGNNGADELYGGTGNDIVHGHVGRDRLFGDAGDDVLYGGLWADVLYAGTGNDRLYGGHSNDTLYGGSGENWLFGGDHNDRIFGGNGIDHLVGGSGNDLLRGHSGDDVFYFGTGFEAGGAGTDTARGDRGADSFAFSGAFGFVTIVDFSLTDGDVLDLSQTGIVDWSGMTVVTDTDAMVLRTQSGTIRLEGLAPSDLGEMTVLWADGF